MSQLVLDSSVVAFHCYHFFAVMTRDSISMHCRPIVGVIIFTGVNTFLKRREMFHLINIF